MFAVITSDKQSINIVINGQISWGLETQGTWAKRDEKIDTNHLGKYDSLVEYSFLHTDDNTTSTSTANVVSSLY